MSDEFSEIFFALSKREMQVAQVIFQNGGASAREIQAMLPIRLANSTVRTVLRSLDRKGVVSTRFIGKKRIYEARLKKHTAGGIVLRKLANTYHKDSYAEALKQIFLLYSSSLTVTQCKEISARLVAETEKRLNDPI